MIVDPEASPVRGGGRRVAAVVVGAVVALVLPLALLPAAGPSGESAAPDGALALRRFLHELGHEVSEGDDPVGADTFVLLSDHRTDAEAASVLRWVARGGRLVLADPASHIAGRLDVEPAGPIGGVFAPTATLALGCAWAPAITAGGIEVGSVDAGLWTDAPAAIGCYPSGSASFVIVRPHGSGTAIVLGGRSPLTNELLDRADNAALAEALVGTRARVRFGPPSPAPRGAAPGPGFWASLPLAAKAVLVQLGLAAVAFAVVRSRRLGRPVLEEPVSPIPAGELVRAGANLYRKGRAAAFCGRLLREGLLARLTRRLGLPAGTPPERVASAAARVAGLPEDRVRRTLAGPDPADDEQLIALGRETEEIRRSVEVRG